LFVLTVLPTPLPSLYGRKIGIDFKIHCRIESNNKKLKKTVQPANPDSSFLIRCDRPAYLVAALLSCVYCSNCLAGATQHILFAALLAREEEEKKEKNKKP